MRKLDTFSFKEWKDILSSFNIPGVGFQVATVESSARKLKRSVRVYHIDELTLCYYDLHNKEAFKKAFNFDIILVNEEHHVDSKQNRWSIQGTFFSFSFAL